MTSFAKSLSRIVFAGTAAIVLSGADDPKLPSKERPLGPITLEAAQAIIDGQNPENRQGAPGLES